MPRAPRVAVLRPLRGLLWMVLAACGARSPERPDAFRYHVTVRSPHAIAVDAVFPRALGDRLTIPLADAVSGVEVHSRRGVRRIASLPADAPECREGCRVRYQVDFDRRRHAPLVFLGADATLTDSGGWLLRAPVPRGQPFEITFEGMADSALRRRGQGYGFDLEDLAEAGFTAFGRTAHATVPFDGGAVELVELARDTVRPEAKAYLAGALGAVAPLWGKRLPSAALRVYVAPVPDQDEVVFGEVRALTGASLVVFMGDGFRAGEAEAAHRDWVLVHELVHIGFPTFQNEGRWLSEGLATYYEPLLRTRAGWRSAEALWGEWRRELERGAGVQLERSGGIDAVYWGGALFLLHADVAIRKATANRRSLDDVVQGIIRAGGSTEHVWTVHDTIARADAISGTHVLADLYERCVVRGETLLAAPLLGELGVGERDGRLELRNDAPLAEIRKRLTAGAR